MWEGMDLAGLFLSVVLAGLAAVLAVVGILAARRFEDRRILFISVAFLALALVGILAIIGNLSPLYGGPFQVQTLPLAVLVVAVILLYASMVHSRPQPPGKAHG